MSPGNFLQIVDTFRHIFYASLRHYQWLNMEMLWCLSWFKFGKDLFSCSRLNTGLGLIEEGLWEQGRSVSVQSIHSTCTKVKDRYISVNALECRGLKWSSSWRRGTTLWQNPSVWQSGAGRNGIPQQAEAAETGRLLSATLSALKSLQALLQQIC